MDRKVQPAGVITVFLSLLLPAFLTFFGTCLESARYEGLRLRGELAADAAVQSVFAAYDRPLYERYGLLFFCTAEEGGKELLQLAGACAIRNTQGDGAPHADLLGLKFVEAEVRDLHTAADDGGAGFLQEVCTLMRQSGRMSAAGAAAAQAGFGGAGEERIALVEFCMQQFRSLTDEADTAWQLESCVTGAYSRSACEAGMRERLRAEREALYLPYFRTMAEQEGSKEASDAPAGPAPEEQAREAAGRDVNVLLAGGAVSEHADGSGKRLTYLQFVRRYLYRTEPSLLRQRAIAVIENDLRSVEPGFAFSSCISAASFRFHFRSEPVFWFSLFSRSYEFIIAAEYAY